MAEYRYFADCRRYPGGENCSLTISGTKEEVLGVAVEHAVAEHGCADTPELREQIHALLQPEKRAKRMRSIVHFL